MGQYDEPVINEEPITDGEHHTNFDAAEDLISAPRKVAQIGINYARASKQVSCSKFQV